MVDKYPVYEFSRIAWLLFSLTFGIVLMAGLWPFYPPRNEAKWVENQNAIRFGRHASLLSIGNFSTNKSNDDGLGSIEIWLTPTVLHSSKTILSFESAEHPGDPFRLIQSDKDLVVQQHNVDEHGICRTAQFSLRDVFRANERVFVALTLGRNQTNVYIRGVLAFASPILGASIKNLTGRLVVGNSPNSNNSWSGDMSGLAIYHRQLTASQVGEHYHSWAMVQKPHISTDETPVAVYLFNEHNGTVIHNQLDAGTDLLLPARFALLRPPFLDPVWRRFRFGWPGWGFWSDVLVNIAGFVPIGFLLLAYLSLLESVKLPAASTILLGFFLSLTIESLQWFLPTRDSDMTDLISNTLGTIVGGSLYRCSGIQKVWLRFMNYSTDWL